MGGTRMRDKRRRDEEGKGKGGELLTENIERVVMLFKKSIVSYLLL